VTVRDIVARPSAGDRAPPATADGSVLSLLIANVIALLVALVQGWDLGSLMTIYWAQSVVIGISYVLRILHLERFSTENFTMNDRPVAPTPETKRNVAAFFAVHFGGFHAAYLVFLASQGAGAALTGLGFWLCIGLFAANHVWSYRYNLELDRQGTPNIGTLMFTPYVRVVPMHLMIVLGALLMDSVAGLLLFGTLKTIADVAFHVIEHEQLKKIRVAP
jgi:hypothetical protein